MLSHACACGRCDDGGRGGNIERRKSLSARPTRIHEILRRPFAVRKYARRMPPHDGGKSRQFLRLDGPLVERREQSHDFRRFHAPGKQFLHHLFRFGAREDMSRFRADDE